MLLPKHFFPRKIDRLTIVGLGKSVYDYVVAAYEYNVDLGEVWTINAGASIFRHDIAFDMHTDEYVAASPEKEKILRRREKLKRHDKPIYMPKASAEYPTSLTYPLREIIGKTGSSYFSNGMAYMIAMALVCEAKEVTFFGCDFSYARDKNSHDEQGRACCEYWVGRLVGTGCKVGHSLNTHFMDMHSRSKGKIYGYHEPVQFDFPVEGGKGVFVGPDYA